MPLASTFFSLSQEQKSTQFFLFFSDSSPLLHLPIHCIHNMFFTVFPEGRSKNVQGERAGRQEL